MIGHRRTAQGVTRLVRRLAAEPREDELCEFKVDNFDPREIGEYVSALANSASVAGQDEAFLVWGVRDDDHEIVGTSFVPSAAKQGNEELRNWLLHSLEPQVGFEFLTGEVDGKHVVVLRVPPAQVQPVKFKGTSHIRIGSYKKRLSDYPEEERRLWRSFDTRSYESGVARADLTAAEVLALIDHESYFRLLDREVPHSRGEVLEALSAERIIVLNPADSWNITHLGAILLARNLDQFPSLARKAIRVIVYDGATRRKTIREQVGRRGYASGFEGLLSWVNDRLPSSEEVGEALRRDVRV